MGQPPNTHVGGQGRTPASAVMAITLAQATCVRASVGALGVSGAQQRVMEAERPVHGDMSLAPVSPSPLAYGQSSTSRPCPRLTSLPMPTAAQLPFSSDLSAGLLVLSPNLPRGPSPGAPTLPLFQERLPRARAQPRVPPHASMAGWQTDLCGRLERQGLSHMRGWHLAAALIVASETGMPSCWAGERMGQPPNTHVGGQGRTPASAVMAITLAQATCVRASVGALGVSGAQQRVMEAERPVHGDMSLAPVSPSPLAYGQSSTSRPLPPPHITAHAPPAAQLPFSSDLSAGLLVLSPNLPRGPSPGAPTLPLFQERLPRARAQPRVPPHASMAGWQTDLCGRLERQGLSHMRGWHLAAALIVASETGMPSCWAGERMGQPPNTHVGGQGRTPASAVMAITLAQATCVRASVGALGVSGAQQRVMEAERPVHGDMSLAPVSPSPLAYGQSSTSRPCPRLTSLPMPTALPSCRSPPTSPPACWCSAPTCPGARPPGPQHCPSSQERLPRARAQPRVPPHASMAGWQTDLCGRLERQGLSHMRGWHLAAALIVASETLPFSSDLSAGLLVLSPNLPRGPSPGAPTLPLFQERLPRARAQPRVPPHASMAGWQTDLCGRLERQGLSHMRGWHLAAALIVASETGMPSCWAGERMGQPPNTHVGGQGRTPASAVMAITLAQATCVRASVGALGVSGAQQRVMEAERPVHGDMSLAPVSPSPLAYGQSSTSRPCPPPHITAHAHRPSCRSPPTSPPACWCSAPTCPGARPPGPNTAPLPGEAATGPGTAPGTSPRLHGGLADRPGMPSCWAGERMGQPPNTHVGGQGRTPASAVMAITLAQATCVRASVGALGVSGAQQRVMEAERPVHGDMSRPPSPLLHSRMDRAPHPGPAPASHHCPCPPYPQLPFSSDLSAGLLVLSPNLPRGPSPGAPTLPLFQERLPRARAQPRVPPHASMAGWQTDLCELHIPALPPPHITAHAHLPQLPFSSDLSAGLLVLSPNLPRGPSPGAPTLPLFQERLPRARAQPRVPPHASMAGWQTDLAPHPGPAPRLTSLPMPTAPQLPFSSDLSAGLLVLSPNLPRGPSPGAPTLPLFQERLPRARAQPRVPPHASMAGWQTDLCGRLERQGLSHMRGWHLAAALIVASETGMPSCWAGERMGQPPNTHVGGQGRTPASAVMAITLAQATCVRASVGALGVSGAQQRVMEAERPVHGDMSLAPVSPSPLAYGQSSTSRPCPRLTSLPMPTAPAAVLLRPLRWPAGAQPQPAPGPVPGAPTLPLFQERLPRARAQPRVPPHASMAGWQTDLCGRLERQGLSHMRGWHLAAALIVASETSSTSRPCPPPHITAHAHLPQLPFSSDLSAGLLVLSPNLPRGPSPGAPTLPLFQERLPRARAQPRVPPHASMAGWQTDLCGRLERQGLSHMRGWHLAAALIVASETGMPSCWAGERMGQPPNTHVGGQGRTPASAVMAITLAQATCVRASVGALGVSGAQQRVMEAERPVHGDMSLAPVSPSPLAYGQSSTSRPCPRLTSLPMPTCPQLPFSSDLSAGLLVLSPNLPRGPSPGPQHCPLFQERLPRARAQPRVPPHASMAGWQTDLCGRLERQGLSHMRGWHLAAALIVASETGMPSCWAGERMGQPPNTHVGGQGRTPASAVMAITLAQATCVRASVGALGVSGAQQRVMEAERPVHGDMSLAPVSPSPLAYGQSSTSRPCPPPHITAHAHLPQLPFSSDLSAGLLVLSPNLPRGPSPGAPTLPLFQERLPRARAQPRVPPHASMAGWQTDLCGRLERQGLSHMRGWHLAAALIVASETGMPSCWAGERMGQPPNTHVGGQGRTPASAVMAITLAQATCVRASVGALGVSGAQQRVMEAERPVHGDMSLAPVSPSPLAYGQSSTSRPCPPPHITAHAHLPQLPFSSDLSAGLLVLSPNLPRGPSPGAPTLPLFQERLPRARAQPRVPPHASMAGWQTDLCGRLERQGLSHMRGWHLAAALIVASETRLRSSAPAPAPPLQRLRPINQLAKACMGPAALAPRLSCLRTGPDVLPGAVLGPPTPSGCPRDKAGRMGVGLRPSGS
ncbi:MAG: hypothetical protein WDW36_010187 [Sanguina aurantia]